jgi:hypothetical protein
MGGSNLLARSPNASERRDAAPGPSKIRSSGSLSGISARYSPNTATNIERRAIVQNG